MDYSCNLDITLNSQSWRLLLGSVKPNFEENLALGVAGIKGVFDGTSMYFLDEAEIKGVKFPFEQGTILQAFNEVQRGSQDNNRLISDFASQLLDNSNVKTKREANLVFVITNIATHLTDASNSDGIFIETLINSSWPQWVGI